SSLSRRVFLPQAVLKAGKNFLPRAAFRGIRQSVPRRVRSSVATAALLIIFTTLSYAQTLAPPKLAATAGQPPPAKKDSIQVVTKEKKPKIITTPISEPIRPIAHYTFKTPEGQRESVQVITHYYPNQIVRPLATADKHIDPKLLRAASIAEERSHAHSRSLCW